MRNPSPEDRKSLVRVAQGLEATYEESKQIGLPGAGGGVYRVWKLPMRNPSKREDSSGS
jgi:hypothetical protein